MFKEYNISWVRFNPKCQFGLKLKKKSTSVAHHINKGRKSI
jgi:hypothetical protein